MSVASAGGRQVWIKTFGCQMNYHDTERVLAILAEHGFTETTSLEEADLVLFNTCAIRQLANQKFYSQLGAIRELKQAKPGMLIGALGCVAQKEGKKLLKHFPELDFVLGPDQLDRIAEVVLNWATRPMAACCEFDRAPTYSLQTKIYHHGPQAFVNIIKGCNNFCTYCIVPFTRGREKSRHPDEIVQDVAQLAAQGVQEINLLGQNVNAYGKEWHCSLAQLIERLAAIKPLRLIRYTTGHPEDFSDELIALHATCPKLAKHLHLPVQSGSNRILQAMHRKHNREMYLALVEKLCAQAPEVVLTTDLIVGFPGETAEDFAATLDLVRQVRFDALYGYKFSPRPGTPAATMPEQIPDAVKKERLALLQHTQYQIQWEIRQGLIGKTLTLLVEGPSQKHQWQGRSSGNRVVHFNVLGEKTAAVSSVPASSSAPLDLRWHWVEVEIEKATAFALYGRCVRDLGR